MDIVVLYIRLSNKLGVLCVFGPGSAGKNV